MSEACGHLHQVLSRWPRYRAGFDGKSIPQNGLYFLFEKDEQGHGVERIVRVGTHTGQNNLAKRIREHMFTPNKDRSIFRKHIGRSLLSLDSDPFLSQWEIDLTTREAREKRANEVDMNRLKEAEDAVSQYMNDNFSFVVFEVMDKAQRLSMEESLLSTIAQCPKCGASRNWLGLHHPNAAIRESGLWNVRGLDGIVFQQDGIDKIFKA